MHTTKAHRVNVDLYDELPAYHIKTSFGNVWTWLLNNSTIVVMLFIRICLLIFNFVYTVSSPAFNKRLWLVRRCATFLTVRLVAFFPRNKNTHKQTRRTTTDVLWYVFFRLDVLMYGFQTATEHCGSIGFLQYGCGWHLFSV